MEKEKQSRSKATYYLIVGVSTAILLATPVIVLTAVGFFLDNLFHTTPIFLLIGGAMGFIGGTMNVYKLITKMKQK